MTVQRLLAVGALAAVLGGYALQSTARPRDLGPAAEQPASPAGEALYDRGVLGSGAPLLGTRADAEPLVGEQAACINCHRRSGLGSKEGRTLIPPITGQFLFHPPAGQLGDVDTPFIPGARLDHAPYTEQTLARALREGIDSEGRPLSALMPRFALNDADLGALTGHLRALDRRHIPGVSSTELHFATIVTPDADPVKRAAVEGVLQQFIADRNAAPRGQAALSMQISGATQYAKSMFKVNRTWVLYVWELEGPASTWRAQLEARIAAQPVFAVLSGIGGRTWAPVSEFCEAHALPCLFPNVEAPPADADRHFDTLYFSRGVLLEADLIATGLGRPGAPAVKRVRQVYRADDVGEAGAAALATVLEARGIAVSNRVLKRAGTGGTVADAVRGLGEDEALVLWLRGADLAALASAPAPSAPVYVSGQMGGLERAPLPADWRGRVQLTYPFDLPERRRVRVDYALGWFRIRKLPVVAEQVQADTYLACGLVAENIKHMVDAFIPDYLVERMEDMVEHRIITGYYPRLALGAHQRFASKGGFLARFDGPGRVVPEGDWITP